MEFPNATFSLVDYAVFGTMLSCSASIGLYYHFTGGKQKTTREYLLADKKMSVLPVSFSLMASFMSAITLLGVAAENYMYGTQFVIINIAYIIGTPIAAYVFLPVFFQVGVTSVFEYLELRFGKLTRILACAVFMLQMILYMSIVLYAPALTLSATTGLPKWISVWSIGIICTFYCTIGGMKAVLWTDVFQSLLMFSAIFVVIIKGTVDVGGFSVVWDRAMEGGRLQFWDFNPDPTVRHTVWTLAIGGIFTYVSIYGINQAQVQRLLTLKKLKDSQKSLFINWPITSLLSIATSFTGLVVYANFYDCDPLMKSKETNVSSSDQILPFFVMKSLGSIPGLPGLFVAGIFSGALSTMSSAINSLAAVTLEDFVRPFCLKKSSESRIAFFTKLIAFIYGALCIALTYVAAQLGGVLQASLTIFNVVGGPLLGLFSLGILHSRANQKGAVVGFLIALALCSWIGFGSILTGVKTPTLRRSISGCCLNNMSTVQPNTFEMINSTITTQEAVICINGTDIDTENINESKHVFVLYRISYMWYAAIGWFVVFLVGAVVSLSTGGNENVDPALLCPFITKKSSILEVMHMDDCS